MHPPLRLILVPLLRVGAMVGLAMLLILGLFPQSSRPRRVATSDYTTSRRLGAPDDPAACDPMVDMLTRQMSW